MNTTTSHPSPPWHSPFPSPRNTTPSTLQPSTLLSRLKSGQTPHKDFLLIDVRKVDHEGGTIRGSLNLPAQSLYPSLPTLLELCASARVGEVVFYCGSCGGRGTRAAGWFDDLLSEKGVTQTKSLMLEGGIKGWVRGGEEYTAFMDGFEAEHWEKFRR